MNTNKDVIKNITVTLFITSLILFSSIYIYAEDYPAGYLGPGHRSYLQDKIRNGYHTETFVNLENRQEERVNKRNQIEGIVSNSYQTSMYSAYGILSAGSQRSRNSQEINWTVLENQSRTLQVAAAQTEFKYIKYSDGKIVYFKDGLPSRIENERVVDEFGNVSIRNTWNMQYSNRMLTGYESSVTDNLGNTTYIYCYGITYSPDSVWYADYDTNAVKNEMEKFIKEIDPAGNVRLTHWQALEYDGHLLRSFHQEIEDSIYGYSSFTRSNITYENGNYRRVSSYHEEGIGTDGLKYTLYRTNITYNDKHLITGYHEERITTQIDGTQTTTVVDAQFRYLHVDHQFAADVEEADPDRLLESIITTTTTNADGSQRTETVTTSYDYDESQQLIGASGYSVFFGQEADWYEYTDQAGHTLTRNVDEEGNVAYTYIDPETLETIVIPESEVTATLKEGNRFRGTTEIQYEILYGKPMSQREDSLVFYYGQNIDDDELIRVEHSTVIYSNGLVNNIRRALGTQEHREITYPLTDPDNIHSETSDITTTYIYDDKGNLIDAQGNGTKSGWEYDPNRGWYHEYTSTLTIEYDVILGKAVRTLYVEDKDYKEVE